MPAVTLESGFLQNNSQNNDPGLIDYQDLLSVTGTAFPGSVVTVYYDTAALGTVIAANDGSWQFRKAGLQNGGHLIGASAVDPFSATTSTIKIYAAPLATDGTSFVFDRGMYTSGIRVIAGIHGGAGIYSTATNHYTLAGVLIDQTYLTAYGVQTVTTPPDANGVTTSSYQTNLNGGGVGANPQPSNIVKNYYDSGYHLLKQETYDRFGHLLQVTTAPDATGHLTSTTYATDGTSVVLDYENGHQSYANHYDATGKITSQDRFDDSNRLISTTTAPDASGHLTSATYAADGTSIVLDYEGGQKSYANHYDPTGRITSQDRFDTSGRLISTTTAADASGHLTATAYAADGTTTVIDYENGQKAYANHYDATGAITSQDRFDFAGRLVSTTTAPDNTGGRTMTDYDAAGHVIAQIGYSSADTALNALHHADGVTQSATYSLTTGDGILPIGFTTGSTTAGDTFTFASNHIVPSHTTILGFDPDDHVVLNGYDPTHFTAQEDGTNVTLTLSDQSVVLFDHVAHVADLHLVWA